MAAGPVRLHLGLSSFRYSRRYCDKCRLRKLFGGSMSFLETDAAPSR